jgi:hypothetical protein
MDKQIKLNTPKLANNQYWLVCNYIVGNSLIRCPHGFNDFKGLQYIKQTRGYHFFIGYLNENLVIFNCLIGMNNES